ncbi:agglutinin biogenesis protein MshI [Massilia sp. CFBP9012]|uniref:type IV pilus biogenesis protein PilM n=1 Tax=Massilia sp. CFBP9012 TaxID=3096531 RepID=UPI002A6B345D|nr:agglutinin biogenesis protein MshI [Massilia sp. CFBP9012]MDY0975051.1 agglutinin biogenesis protein MshI [Massilia sp. CFBP9012]
MRLFNRGKKKEGWLSIALLRDGVATVTVHRDANARPALGAMQFFLGHPGDDALDKVARDGHAASRHIVTLLSGGEYQILNVEAPNVPREEMKTAIRWRLKDILDFPAAEATIDVLDIPLDANSRAQQSVFAVAARNTVIQPRQKLFLDAKVDLHAIDIPEMAQRNVSAMLEPEGRGVAMLSFGDDGGLLTVSYRGELYLSRRFDVTLAQLLEPDHERKHQSFDKITLELQRSLDHFERQYSFISIAKLVLGPSPVSGLDEYLSSNLYTPVETLDLATLFDLSRTPELADKAQQQRFFLAIGAALREGEGA